MFKWSDKKIEWYERALKESNFAARLADALEPFLTPGESVCELGCGTGYLSLELARRGFSVMAVEADKNAASCLRAKVDQMKFQGQIGMYVDSGSKSPNGSVAVYQGDWKEILGSPRWDTIIMCFAGDFRHELPLYLKSCRGKLLLVTTEPKDDQEGITGKSAGFRYRLKESETRKLLDEQGAAYTITKASLELGQPFVDMEEAREYHDAYSVPEEQYNHNLKKMVMSGNPFFPYYLPNHKELKIYQIFAKGRSGIAGQRGNPDFAEQH